MRRALALVALAIGCSEPAVASEPLAPTALPTPRAPPPTPTTPELARPRRGTISAAGDLVLNSLAMRAVRGLPTEDAGYRALLDGYARSIREDEIAYLNLETPLVDDVVALDGGWPASLP